MAHLSEGTLRRMVDEPDAHTGPEARHYAKCEECQGRYRAVADDARAIQGLLAVPGLEVDVASAFERVASAPAAQPKFGLRLPLVRPISRPLVIGLAAAIGLTALVATSIAQDGNFFAPTTVTPVPVTVADMQALSELSAYGTVTWTARPQPQVVTSAAEAASVSGLRPPVVGALPAGVSSTVTYAALPKAVGVFTFSQDQAAAAAKAAGKTLPAMPSGLDGATLTVTVGPAVVEVFGNLNSGSSSQASMSGLPQLVIAESSAPVATSTQVTVKQLEDYLLALPGISPQLSAAIRAIGDPSTTLPIPIPIQYATSSNVQVEGVQGVALGDNTGLGSAVIWVKNGVVYGVAGTLKQSQVVDIANHLG
ncbi:hypothetical protein EPN29_12555 [bacterium]|nr:MAG: hypothetical protein EPN29_12555 [bacterium]